MLQWEQLIFSSASIFLDTIMGIIKVKSICVHCHLLIHTSFHHWHTVIYRVDMRFLYRISMTSQNKKKQTCSQVDLHLNLHSSTYCVTLMEPLFISLVSMLTLKGLLLTEVYERLMGWLSVPYQGMYILLLCLHPLLLTRFPYLSAKLQ